MPLKNAIKKFGGQFADKEPLVDLHHVVKTYESPSGPFTALQEPTKRRT